MNERDAKFFRPLWIRLLVTGLLVVWFGLEAAFTHDQLWMGVTAVGVAYCVWNFFLRFPKEPPTTDATAGTAPPSDGSSAGPLPPKQP